MIVCARMGEILGAASRVWRRRPFGFFGLVITLSEKDLRVPRSAFVGDGVVVPCSKTQSSAVCSPQHPADRNSDCAGGALAYANDES